MPAMRPLLALLFLLLAPALHAQEAPGEDLPGMHTRPDLAPSKELSPEERQGLNGLFKGKLEEEKPKKPAPTIEVSPSTEPVPPSEPAPASGGNISPQPAIAPMPDAKLYMNTAHVLKFNILNKQTTRLYPQELNAGGSTNFGPLTIKLIECWHSSPETTPDSAALLQISEKRADAKPKTIFLGWMFASSPSLNPLEHPVYDITVKECR